MQLVVPASSAAPKSVTLGWVGTTHPEGPREGSVRADGWILATRLFGSTTLRGSRKDDDRVGTNDRASHLMRKWFRTASRKRKISTAEITVCKTL